MTLKQLLQKFVIDNICSRIYIVIRISDTLSNMQEESLHMLKTTASVTVKQTQAANVIGIEMQIANFVFDKYNKYSQYQAVFNLMAFNAKLVLILDEDVNKVDTNKCYYDVDNKIVILELL